MKMCDINKEKMLLCKYKGKSEEICFIFFNFLKKIKILQILFQMFPHPEILSQINHFSRNFHLKIHQIHNFLFSSVREFHLYDEFNKCIHYSLSYIK